MTLIMVRNNGEVVTANDVTLAHAIKCAAGYLALAAGNDATKHFGRIFVSTGHYLQEYQTQEVYRMARELA